MIKLIEKSNQHQNSSKICIVKAETWMGFLMIIVYQKMLQPVESHLQLLVFDEFPIQTKFSITI